MKKRKRVFCPYCGNRISQKYEEESLRDYCTVCNLFFYDNPLPVVSMILLEERKILLVKRGKTPYRSQWCLPSGFVEIDESIEEAALRELEEETGVKGMIVSNVDVDSCTNYFYGDLIFLTFEVEQIGGEPAPGSDTVAVKYFPIERIPRLAFGSNTKAVETYIKSKADYWAIIDSFAHAVKEGGPRKKKTNLLSDRLVDMIQENAETIAHKWLKDVTKNKSTYSYRTFNSAHLFRRVHYALSHFSDWLEGTYTEEIMQNHYTGLGKERRKQKVKLYEVLSSLNLIKKHIWEFALSQGMWTKPIDIYMVLEMERRIVIYFDKITFYTTVGYMEERA
ncbi:MAG: NUDIX hydrolase [Deltaproteobacteria bacterium]|nr:NUDIX hydrolase [Deltaproteobacteria bacterium]